MTIGSWIVMIVYFTQVEPWWLGTWFTFGACEDALPAFSDIWVQGLDGSDKSLDGLTS